MKENKKAIVRLKSSQSREDIKNSKNRLDDLFKSLKSGIKSIVKPKEKNLPSANKISSGELIKRNSKHNSIKRTSKIEVYSTTQVLSGVRRKTSDNLPIYTMEELNIGKGGNTEHCPFDCQCCY